LPLARLLFAAAGSAARGTYVSVPGISDLRRLGPGGRRFVERFGATLAGREVEPSAVYAAKGMEVALDAIARSDGTRASVRDALFATRIPNGLIGPVRFSADGDLATGPVTILRAQGGDGVVERIQQVPVALLR
jgi:ABC-type branched-subunit amino acid transport system substrate-binding protein